MFPFYKVRVKCDHPATGKIPILCKTCVQPFNQFGIVLRICCAGHIRERYFEILFVCQRSPDTHKLKWTIDIVYHYMEHCEQLKKSQLVILTVTIKTLISEQLSGSHTTRTRAKNLDLGFNRLTCRKIIKNKTIPVIGVSTDKNLW